jgi:hypothetical protein
MSTKRFLFCFLLFAFCFLLSAFSVAAQGQQPDQETYNGWVREAFAAAQRNDRIGLEETAERLINTSGVQLPDGTIIPVDNRWLRDELAKTDPDLPFTAERLGAIIDALAQPTSAVPDNALSQLDALMSRSPYAQDDPNNQNFRWLIDFLDWVGRLLDSLFSPLGAAPAGAGSVVAWLIGGIGGALLLGVLIYLLLGLRRNLVSEAQAKDDDPEANLTARTALDQASDLARGGDYRTAVRYLYLSALLWLDERDMLRYDRALTNREYLERVRDNPALRARLSPIVETFDRVWYGHSQLDEAAFAAYREQVEALRDDKVTRSRGVGA